MCIKCSSKGKDFKKNCLYAVTPAFMLGSMKCVCLLAFKPDCILLKSWTMRTVGTMGCSFENYNLFMRSSETLHNDSKGFYAKNAKTLDLS